MTADLRTTNSWEPARRHMTEPTVQVRVPKVFYDDHVSRGCDPGHEDREDSRGYWLTLDAEAYDDLMTDADLYADGGTAEFGVEYLGLVTSARATLKALRAVEVPWS